MALWCAHADQQPGNLPRYWARLQDRSMQTTPSKILQQSGRSTITGASCTARDSGRRACTTRYSQRPSLDTGLLLARALQWPCCRKRSSTGKCSASRPQVRSVWVSTSPIFALCFTPTFHRRGRTLLPEAGRVATTRRSRAAPTLDDRGCGAAVRHDRVVTAAAPRDSGGPAHPSQPRSQTANGELQGVG